MAWRAAHLRAEVEHFALRDGRIAVDDVPWAKQGDAVSWLVSEAFGLQQGRSREAERAIEKVPSEIRWLVERTLKVLPIAHDERVIRQRRSWYEMYLKGDLPLTGLRKVAPLIGGSARPRSGGTRRYAAAPAPPGALACALA